MLISVCVKAKDLTQALHAADMFRSTGRKLDTILYTNLIGGQPLPCAMAQDCPSSVHLALIEACWNVQYPKAWSPDGVLYAVCAAVGDADKAFQLYTSMKAEGIKSDPQVRKPTYNAPSFVHEDTYPFLLLLICRVPALAKRKSQY